MEPVLLWILSEYALLKVVFSVLMCILFPLGRKVNDFWWCGKGRGQSIKHQLRMSWTQYEWNSMVRWHRVFCLSWMSCLEDCNIIELFILTSCTFYFNIYCTIELKIETFHILIISTGIIICWNGCSTGKFWSSLHGSVIFFPTYDRIWGNDFISCVELS